MIQTTHIKNTSHNIVAWAKIFSSNNEIKTEFLIMADLPSGDYSNFATHWATYEHIHYSKTT
jgi:hypothetical protein